MSQFVLADNVKETTTTTGTGTVSLLGAFAASFKTFVSGIGSAKLTAYKIDDGAGNWECRYGVIASGTPDTITNAGFISSSTGSAVTFLAGTKTVTCVPLTELFLTAAVSSVLAETTIASATTTDLGSIQTLRALITGTVTITGLGTSPNTLRFVRFSGALTLTHDGTSLILPGAANIATAAGDMALFVSDGSGNWRCLWYQRGASAPNVPTRQVLTSGSGAAYTTPGGVRQLRIRMVGAGGGGGSGADTANGAGNAGSSGGFTSFDNVGTNYKALGGGGGNLGNTFGSVVQVRGAVGGTGGTGGTTPNTARTPGTSSNSLVVGNNGGIGGASLLGGSAQSVISGNGNAAAANTGAGGGGGASGNTGLGGTGGGSGEYVEILINSPSATYTYTVGTGGAGGTGTVNGGAGGSGLIIVDEIY
jgi:hypothetical protein